MNITFNGQKMTIDGDCISINTTKGQVLINGEQIEGAEKIIDIYINGNVGKIDCNGVVEVTGDVEKEINAGGSVTCKNVSGNIDAGGSVTCKDVSGNVDSGGSVTCENIEGNIDAGGSVRIGKDKR